MTETPGRADAAWRDWTHVTKLDPDKDLPDGVTYADVCETGTDAVVVGGTTGVTDEDAREIAVTCHEHDVPVYQEPNTPDVVLDDDAVDGYLVPTVLNAGDPFWIVGAHKEGVRLYPDHPWERTTTEAYVVLNPDSAVARYTEADCDLDADDVAAYAGIAERFFGQEIVYIEYSGTYGDPDVVAAAADAVEEATLFYGGGIHDADDARTMVAAGADLVVVGNALYDEGLDTLQRTVEGVRDV